VLSNSFRAQIPCPTRKSKNRIPHPKTSRILRSSPHERFTRLAEPSEAGDVIEREVLSVLAGYPAEAACR